MSMLKSADYGDVQGTPLGNKATVKPGEYEIVTYSSAGAAHTHEHLEIEQPITGLVVDDHWLGAQYYNVFVRQKKVLGPSDDKPEWKEFIISVHKSDLEL